MTLGSAAVMAFVATTDPQSAREFYEGVLGPRFVGEEPGQALVFAIGDAGTLRITVLPEHVPPPYSVLGWHLENIEAEVNDLIAAGVVFELFEMLTQDDRGIWTFPNGDRVARFKDPAGNMLSVTQAG